MGNADRLANPARVVDILSGTTRPGTMHRSTVVVELQRDAEHVVALALQDAGHHRAVDAAGHGNDDAGIFRTLVEIE